MCRYQLSGSFGRYHKESIAVIKDYWVDNGNEWNSE